jgi:hypothetical protein
LRRKVLIEAGVPGWVADTRSMGEEMPSGTHNVRYDALNLEYNDSKKESTLKKD